MNNDYSNKFPPSMKDFYKVSRERLEAYIMKLDEANEIIRRARIGSDKGGITWEEIDAAWSRVIDVFNSLYGFKNYEDYDAGGEFIQDLWIEHSNLDNIKFTRIEFPNGFENKNAVPSEK